jgi:hypothetical protein
MRTTAIIPLLLVTMWLQGLSSAEAGLLLAQATPPGQSGFLIQVPHRSGQVYIPLDPSGRPMFPSGIPAEPAAPSSPASPAAPSQPLPPDWGFLRTEVDPGAARVYIDGQYVGIAQQFAGPQGFLTLPPGPRWLEITHPGFKPLRTAVEISPRLTSILRLLLEPDPREPVEEPRGPGYHVVPPAGREPSRSPTGGGYFVVPKP